MEGADLALLLMLDGSASVGIEEFGLIADGCAAGLRDPEVATALVGGPRQASLLAVLLWSGRDAQAVLLPWTRVGSPEELAAFADALANMPRAVRAGTTAIGAALLIAERMLASLPVPVPRHVVDVAGDGRSNDGPPPGPVRDRMAAAGVTVNGLCVLHDEPDLVESYRREVIGGPDAFAVACADFAGFADAMRRKLARESQLATSLADRFT